ncbi:hypothetical protein HDU96_008805 [Phlyctochytrium bullatum]|nr:hypothetical protein HDU96_008805 [Phlyctochytrium bullatum]
MSSIERPNPDCAVENQSGAAVTSSALRERRRGGAEGSGEDAPEGMSGDEGTDTGVARPPAAVTVVLDGMGLSGAVVCGCDPPAGCCFDVAAVGEAAADVPAFRDDPEGEALLSDDDARLGDPVAFVEDARLGDPVAFDEDGDPVAFAVALWALEPCLAAELAEGSAVPPRGRFEALEPASPAAERLEVDLGRVEVVSP